MRKLKQLPNTPTLIAKAIVIVVAVVIGAAIALVVARELFPGNPWTFSECDRVEKDSVVSPDGSWIAKNFFFGCHAGLMTEAWYAVVIVKRGLEPDLGDEVWKGDIYSQDKVSLEWKNADHLQITLPNEAVIYEQKSNHSGVTIELLKDPDFHGD